MILRADLRLGQRQHLQRVLRIGEALEPALTQGIECDDRYAALPDLIELMQHARTVDADILAEEEHAVSMVEILDLHRADRNADGFRKSDRRVVEIDPCDGGSTLKAAWRRLLSKRKNIRVGTIFMMSLYQPTF